MSEVRAWARIDEAALRANFRQARELAPGDHIIGVVKAEAYGHGAVPIALGLAAAGCDELAVASVDEGCLLREAGVESSILVLGGVDGAADARDAVEQGLAVVVHHAGHVDALLAAGGAARVTVELDTGMHRMGAAPGEARALLEQVAAAPSLELEGVMTHLARADEPDLAPSLEQLARFRVALAEARAAGISPPRVHYGNSAALLAGSALRAACPEANAVRPGLMLYGVRPAAHLPGRLAPVMSLFGRVAQVRDVAAGEAVGYGALWRADAPTRVATVAIGYADGMPVSTTNQGEVVIRGQRHRIVGRVSMDYIGVDIGAANVAIGDEALIFGASGDATLPVEEAAAAAGTLSYELLTRVGPRVMFVHAEPSG